MDFEQQLEKAEKLDSPSLVGSSLRSADDSAHNNYIHPEKFKKTPVSYSKLGLHESISASLDDLISEGALIGSEEDFDRFLDDKGNVKADAKFLSNDPDADKASIGSPLAAAAAEQDETDAKAQEEAPEALEPEEVADESPTPETPAAASVASAAPAGAAQASSAAPAASATTTTSFYQPQDYSNPNLSDYQLEHSISSHDDLLDKIRQEDPHRRDFAKDNKAFEQTKPDIKPLPLLETRAKGPEGFHSPYFQKDLRSDSTSRSRYDRSPSANRSNSRSSSGVRPHLARGDSYKNTHDLDPARYELPANLETPEEDDSERQSRRSRPTMGESIAAAEQKETQVLPDDSDSTWARGDASLLTTGDYTNFNVDRPEPSIDSYANRSASAVNYLRSISRSRSRQPHINEKNDANPAELYREGALINEDPYSAIDNLDGMMQSVLQKKTHSSPLADQSGESVKEPELPTNKEPKIGLDKDASHDPVHTHDAEGESAAKTDPVDVSLVPEDAIPVAEKTDSSDVKVVDDDEPSKSSADADKPVDEPQTESPTLIKDQSEVGPELDETVDSDLKADEDAEPELPVASEKLDLDTKVADEESDEVKEVVTTKEATESKDEEVEPVQDDEVKSVVPEVKDKEEAEEAVEAEEANVETDKEAKVETDKEAEDVESEIKTDKEVKAEAEEEEAEEKEAEEKEEEAEEKEAEEKEEEEEEETKEKEAVKEVKPAPIEAESESAETSKSVETESKSVVGATTAAIGAAVGTAFGAGATAKDTAKETDDLDFEDISPEELRKHLESQPVYLFTSLAGGMQIVHKTNRLMTILRANQIQFTSRDLGVDEDAKKIWRRYSNGKTLPGVVRGDDFIGNWQDIEEANEEYKVRELVYETL